MAGQTSGIHHGVIVAGRGAGKQQWASLGLAGREAVEVPRWAPWLALLLLVLLLPTGYENWRVYWNVALLVGGAYALMRLAQGEWPLLRWDGLSALLTTGAGMATVQLATGLTDSPFLTLNGLQFWWGSLLLLPLLRDGLARWLPQRRGLDLLAGGLLAMYLASLAMGLFQTFQGVPGEGWALWWPFLYRNHLAAFVVLMLPLLVWRWSAAGKGRWVALAAATAGSVAVAASGSRAGVVLVAAIWAIAGFWHLRARDASQEAGRAKHTGRELLRGAGVRGWGLAALALVMGIAMLSSAGGLAVLEYRLAHWSPLLEGRWDYWRASAEMIAERPVVGWGFGMWPDVYRQFLKYDSELVVNRAHSDWLEWTAKGGLPMAAALCWVLWGALRRAWMTPWVWGMPLLLAYGMVDYTLRAPLVWVAFLTLWMAAEGSDTPIGSPTEWHKWSPGSCGSARGDGTVISCVEGESRD